ncbi:MAG: hypothetical protein KI790_11100 [Cyclobacteriaceae bacterium]|nr:hypothetical protein [Cyclobacteriaceae bacterium HetDA_MAG_MS6]
MEIKYALFCACFALTSLIVIAQPKETLLTEDEVDLSLVTKHYLKYPNLIPQQWSQFEVNAEHHFKALVEMADGSMSIIYDASGKRLEEWRVRESPMEPVTQYLAIEFAKYKMLSFKTVTDFRINKTYLVAEIKSKFQGYQEVKFDMDGNPDWNRTSQYAAVD